MTEDESVVGSDLGVQPPSVLPRTRRRLRSGAAAGILLAATVLGGSVALAFAATDSSTNAAATSPSAPVETEPSTTAAPTTVAADAPTTVATPTVAGGPTTTTAPTAKKPRATAPVYVGGVPQVRATPGAGRVGARIRVEGYGFSGEQWAAPDAPLWLALEGGCGLYAEARHTLRVTGDGRLAGEITIPAAGACRQSDMDDEPVVAGRYRIAFSCTACFIGEVRVTGPAAATRCRNVGFTPNSDDVASSIVARNVPCSQAESLVRKVGRPLGFNGVAEAGADGFRCVRTGQAERALPMAFYECTKGPRSVTFTRT